MKHTTQSEMMRASLILALIPLFLASIFVLIAGFGAGDVVHKKTRKSADMLFGSTVENMFFASFFYTANAVAFYLMLSYGKDGGDGRPSGEDAGSGLTPANANLT